MSFDCSFRPPLTSTPSSSSFSSFGSTSSSSTFHPSTTAYNPPRSSPISIPFTASVELHHCELDAFSLPRPTRLAPPLVRPFKAHLYELRNTLDHLHYHLRTQSAQRIAGSLKKLVSLDARVSSAVLEALLRLATQGGGAAILLLEDYLVWSQGVVKECHATLDWVTSESISFEAFRAFQVGANLRTARNMLGTTDSRGTTAVLDSLEGWSQPCSQAVREILYDERLSNEQRRAEISRVKQRFANREEYFPEPTACSKPTLTQLAFILAPPRPPPKAVATSGPVRISPSPQIDASCPSSSSPRISSSSPSTKPFLCPPTASNLTLLLAARSNAQPIPSLQNLSSSRLVSLSSSSSSYLTTSAPTLLTSTSSSNFSSSSASSTATLATNTTSSSSLPHNKDEEEDAFKASLLLRDLPDGARTSNSDISLISKASAKSWRKIKTSETTALPLAANRLRGLFF